MVGQKKLMAGQIPGSGYTSEYTKKAGVVTSQKARVKIIKLATISNAQRQS